jgi:hypothetical protein
VPRIDLDALLAQKPRSGMFLVEGWVQDLYHCACPPHPAICKPCPGERVWVSSTSSVQAPQSHAQDLAIEVADATAFQKLGHYRFTIVACGPGLRPTAPVSASLCNSQPIP